MPAPQTPAREAIREALLYGILDLSYVTPGIAPAAAAAMLEGGVGALQLRAKRFAPSEIAPVASAVARLCRATGVPFLINDHPDLVAPCGADGVHVGQDDLPVAEARERIGPGGIVGKSTHSLDQARAAVEEGADYIGFGPLFATPTKPDYRPIGTEEIRRVHELAGCPVFCIGGIKLENLDAVLNAGARRVVIVSGILQAGEIPAYCRAALEKLRARA